MFSRKKIDEIRWNHASQAAVRMLTELKLQFNVVTEYSDWDSYRLLILPDNVRLSKEVAARIEKHLAKGGSVIASAYSGLDPEDKQFVLKDLAGPISGPDRPQSALFPAVREGRQRTAGDGPFPSMPAEPG